MMPPQLPKTPLEDDDPQLFQRAGKRYYEHDAPSKRKARDERDALTAHALRAQQWQREEDRRVREAWEPAPVAEDTIPFEVERQPEPVKRSWWEKIAALFVWM